MQIKQKTSDQIRRHELYLSNREKKLDYSKRYYLKNKKRLRQYYKLRYISNPEKSKDNSAKHQASGRKRDLARITTIYSTHKIFKGLNKRPYAGNCEICNKSQDRRLSYHHWDDNNPNLGIWVCNPCHWFITGFEKGLQIQKYLDIKAQVQSTWK